MNYTVNFPNAVITFQPGSVSIVLPDSILSAISGLDSKIDLLVSQGGLVLSNQSSNQGVTMALIDDLEAKVTQIQGDEASLVTLFTTFHDELVAANVNNPRVQAVIDSLETGSHQRLLAAIAANPDPNAMPPPAPPV